MLPPQALLARLESRLKVLTGGARDLPARQQTLRGAIDWSYNLLDPGEQTLFAWLSVFVGGCTLEAVEDVCARAGGLPDDVLDGLSSLVDKSLLRQEDPAIGRTAIHHAGDDPRVCPGAAGAERCRGRAAGGACQAHARLG